MSISQGNPMNELLKSIENEQDKMISILKNWASINSCSDNLTGLENLLIEIKKEAECLDGTIEEIELPKRKQLNSKGELIEIENGKALLIKKNPSAKCQILFGGHYDTVFSKDSPFQEVKQIEDHKLQGPGVADMKGGLVVLLTSLKILKMSPFGEKLGYEIIINPDEEVGSTGSYELYRKHAKGKMAGLIFEPCFSDGSIVSSRKGSINYSVTCHGKKAHAGRDFEKGKSAIVAISKFIHKAHELNHLIDGLTVNIGAVKGGEAVNIVPDFALCHLNIRYVDPKDKQKIQAKLNELIENASKEDGIRFFLYEISARDPKPFDEKTIKLFDILKKVGLQLNQKMTFVSSGGVSDGNILAGVNLPTIDTLGVVGGHIHTFDEYMLLDSLKEKVKLTVCLLIELIKSSENE